MSEMRYAQTEAVDLGSLKVEVVANKGSTPIPDATISISYAGEPEAVVEEVVSDESGMSESISLNTPPLEYSMEPSENQPFSQYTIQVTAPGYRPFTVSGIEVF